ncbi:NUDIX hydrolase [Mesoplasma seiffertii]|uniref:NUDIX hydrolase n=1 Tax=Mesoplasma seiffertii TaxID=28224 RepID=UPI000478A2B7|nr:NUDIX domain-containing protein [Mesoplasma seiffertii]
MEILDLYDINRIKTSKKHLRGEKVIPDHYRLVVRAAIFNEHNQMLIQKRQATKQNKRWDNYWDISVSGSVIQGETSQQGIQREVQEELGLHYDFSQTRPALTINFYEGFDDIYLIEIPKLDIATLTLQPEEVAAIKWATQAEIIEMIDQGIFVTWNKDLLNLLFSLKGKWSNFDI